MATKKKSPPAGNAARAAAKRPSKAKVVVSRTSTVEKMLKEKGEVKLSLVPKSAYANNRKRGSEKLKALEKGLTAVLNAMKRSKQPIALSDLDMMTPRIFAKHGFRLGRLRLYVGSDRRLYAGSVTGTPVKSIVLGKSKPASAPSKPTGRGNPTPARQRAGSDPLEDAVEHEDDVLEP